VDTEALVVSIARQDDLLEIGSIMAEEYSKLEGFPSREDQPSYYDQFYKLNELTESNTADVLVAKDQHRAILGGVVFFSDMKSYGAGGEVTTSIKNAAGIRLLAVSSQARRKGIGRQLTEFCIDLARESNRSRVILHTTQSMPVAWKLYESMGFTRFEKLDFMQAELEVFGFQLQL